jgi:hypothetical protein
LTPALTTPAITASREAPIEEEEPEDGAVIMVLAEVEEAPTLEDSNHRLSLPM